MAVGDYSATPALNITVNGINIAEGCPPANLNNALRQIMSDVRVFYNAALKVGFNVTIQEEGGAMPATPVENDIVIEYEP